jgi:hypothetical protein
MNNFVSWDSVGMVTKGTGGRERVKGVKKGNSLEMGFEMFLGTTV